MTARHQRERGSRPSRHREREGESEERKLATYNSLPRLNQFSQTNSLTRQLYADRAAAIM